MRGSTGRNVIQTDTASQAVAPIAPPPFPRTVPEGNTENEDEYEEPLAPSTVSLPVGSYPSVISKDFVDLRHWVDNNSHTVELIQESPAPMKARAQRAKTATRSIDDDASSLKKLRSAETLSGEEEDNSDDWSVTGEESRENRDKERQPPDIDTVDLDGEPLNCDEFFNVVALEIGKYAGTRVLDETVDLKPILEQLEHDDGEKHNGDVIKT